MNSSAKLIATSALLLVGILNANGAILEQKGQAEASLSQMTTYGMDVTTRSGLKTVLPPGWQLFIHPSAKLPDTMSWKVGDPWPAVLAKFAQGSDVSVLVDWDSRQVLMRTEQVAEEERSTRSQIQAAATTPLPRFTEAPREQAALPVSAPSTNAVPVIRVNPTPVMVEEQQQAALRSPPQLKSTRLLRCQGVESRVSEGVGSIHRQSVSAAPCLGGPGFSVAGSGDLACPQP